MGNLFYQPLTDSHAESLQFIWSDQEVIRYTNMTMPCTLEETRDRIEVLKRFDVFVVIKDETIIGLVGCPCVDESQSYFGLFYQFCKSAWGQGNATCATQWILDFMEQKYPNVTLFADVVVDNVASERILRKFGFICTSEDDFIRNGKKSKIHHYRRS